MKIILNGEPHELDGDATVGSLLDGLKLHDQRVAVMVNDAVIRKPQRASAQLREGDKVEIITMVGGG